MFETIVALVTPFTENNLIDFEGLIACIDHQIDNGVDGIVVLGSTGECSAISDDERALIYHFVTKYVNKKVKVILGVGSNSYEKTLKNIKMAESTDCDALLIVAPYYVCPNQKGLEAYFDRVISSTSKNCILYNVKKRCGVELEPETVHHLLSKHDTIVALKQAGGNYEEYLYLRNIFTGFKLYSGDDQLLIKAIDLGLDGIISVIGNAYPAELVDIKYSRDEKWLKKICDCIYRYPSPTGIKAVMEMMKLCERNVRLPLVEIDENEFNEIQLKIQ